MKRAFTLVEMLIVVAILAILMTMTFRLLKTGDDDNKRTNTLVTMQKIENCLSGYYAAFGSYPPVKLHASRNFRLRTQNGQQTNTERGGGLNDDDVQTACRAQPFGCEYPPGEAERKVIESWAKEMTKCVQGGYANFQSTGYFEPYSYAFTGSLTAPDPDTGFDDNTFSSGGATRSEWTQGVCVFKFGVMSFLLPRYLFMMRGDSEWFGGKNGSDVFGQWSANNDMPHDPLKGVSYSDVQEGGSRGWGAINNLANGTGDTDTRSDSQRLRDRARVENIPSQAVCARWVPNLAGVCSTTLNSETFFGINITRGTWRRICNGWTGSLSDPTKIYPPKPLPIHRPASGGQGYCNAWTTIQDGWGKEFFYYSPAPYQSYMVWSAGPNHKTFPPWVSMEELSDSERKTAMEWKGDDLMSMGEGRPGAKESNVLDMK